MATRFIDGLGRTISRDPNILDILLKNYQSSNHAAFAQAGMEIEALNAAVLRLNEELDSLRKNLKEASAKTNTFNASKNTEPKKIVAKVKPQSTT